MDTKTIAMVVVGILVGAGVGMGVGYFIWNDGDDDNKTYWFYLDYDGEAGHENKWVSASASNVIDGLKKALDDNNISYAISNTGWITSIDGLENGDWEDGDEGGGDNWMNWFWSSETNASYATWYASSGLDITVGTIFYIGYSWVDGGTYETSMDPNTQTGWSNSGPFATA